MVYMTPHIAALILAFVASGCDLGAAMPIPPQSTIGSPNGELVVRSFDAALTERGSKADALAEALGQAKPQSADSKAVVLSEALGQRDIRVEARSPITGEPPHKPLTMTTVYHRFHRPTRRDNAAGPPAGHHDATARKRDALDAQPEARSPITGEPTHKPLTMTTVYHRLHRPTRRDNAAGPPVGQHDATARKRDALDAQPWPRKGGRRDVRLDARTPVHGEPPRWDFGPHPMVKPPAFHKAPPSDHGGDDAHRPTLEPLRWDSGPHPVVKPPAFHHHPRRDNDAVEARSPTGEPPRWHFSSKPTIRKPVFHQYTGPPTDPAKPLGLSYGADKRDTSDVQSWPHNVGLEARTPITGEPPRWNIGHKPLINKGDMPKHHPRDIDAGPPVLHYGANKRDAPDAQSWLSNNARRNVGSEGPDHAVAEPRGLTPDKREPLAAPGQKKPLPNRLGLHTVNRWRKNFRFGRRPASAAKPVGRRDIDPESAASVGPERRFVPGQTKVAIPTLKPGSRPGLEAFNRWRQSMNARKPTTKPVGRREVDSKSSASMNAQRRNALAASILSGEPNPYTPLLQAGGHAGLKAYNHWKDGRKHKGGGAAEPVGRREAISQEAV